MYRFLHVGRIRTDIVIQDIAEHCNLGMLLPTPQDLSRYRETTDIPATHVPAQHVPWTALLNAIQNVPATTVFARALACLWSSLVTSRMTHSMHGEMPLVLCDSLT
jgi:hypothetical protein